MSIKSTVRKKLFESANGQVLFYKIRQLREKNFNRYSDIDLIQKIYQERFFRKADFAAPKTYTEKLQWLKLFYRNEKMPICSDKYRVREYLKDCGLENLGNEVLGVYKDAREIDFDKLPDKFVTKANSTYLARIGIYTGLFIPMCLSKVIHLENTGLRSLSCLRSSGMLRFRLIRH